MFSIASILSILISPICSAQNIIQFSKYVDNAGNIQLPNNFRQNMTHLGSWFVPEGDSSGFHDVYTEKDSIDYYQSSKKFKDGTILVKELRAHQSKDYTTGANVKQATGIKQWFVMIKDTESRFPNNRSWGNGWGWALFMADDANKNISTDYQKDCQGCHLPAKNTDWVYIEAYPTLKTKK